MRFLSLFGVIFVFSFTISIIFIVLVFWIFKKKKQHHDNR